MPTMPLGKVRNFPAGRWVVNGHPQTQSQSSRKLISFLSLPRGLRISWLTSMLTISYHIPVDNWPNLILKLHLKKV